MKLSTLQEELKHAVNEPGAKRDLARIMLSGKPETRVRDLLHCRLFDVPGMRPFSEWSGKVGGQQMSRVDLAVHSHRDGVPTALHGLVEFKAWMGIDVYDTYRWDRNLLPDKLGHSIIGQFEKDAAKLRQGRNGGDNVPWMAICTLLYYVRPRQRPKDLIPHLKYPGVVRQDVHYSKSMDEMCKTFVSNMSSLVAALNPPITIHAHEVLMTVDDILGHDVALAAVWCTV
jgi:hypothetical protein